MIRFVFITCLFAFAQHTIIYAQTEQRCHTTEFRKADLERHPELLHQIIADEKQLQEWIQHHMPQSGRNIITIPVVVHIVFPESQLYTTVTAHDVASQIDALNEDYRRQNVDANKTPDLFQSVSSDLEIQFCLAKRTPDNQPTTGILYEPNPLQEWDGAQLETLKQFAWPKEKYLNIWVCKMADNVIGYATFPNTTETDGVIIASRAFGRVSTKLSGNYNLGRTGTHEVAHWLNVYHVNGDDGNQCSGSDFCDDTPNQADQNYGCPTFPNPSCSNTSDMFMNYLDYTRDSCMNLFSANQKQRMIATLNNTRLSILSSDGCTPFSEPQTDIQVEAILYPSGIVNKRSIAPQVRIANNGSGSISSCSINYGFFGQDMLTYSWTGNLPAKGSEIVVLPKIMDSVGYSIFICYAYNLNNGAAEFDTINNFMSRRIYVPSDAVKDTIGENVLIFPNPSSGTYTLKFDSLVADDYTVELFNVVGQLINADVEYNTLNQLQINMLQAAPGLYFVRIRNGRNKFSGKLLKLQ
ncbi:MAG: T9SS type A sorting domain-containing protein [Bacteroidota bacterium]